MPQGVGVRVPLSARERVSLYRETLSLFVRLRTKRDAGHASRKSLTVPSLVTEKLVFTDQVGDFRVEITPETESRLQFD